VGVVREGLVESARHAGEHGVTLALQNHAPVIGGYKTSSAWCARSPRPTSSLLRRPLEHELDAEGVRKATVEVGPLQVLSHYGGEYQEGPRRDQGDRRRSTAWRRSGAARDRLPGLLRLRAVPPAAGGRGPDGRRRVVHENARLAASTCGGVIAEARKQKATRPSLIPAPHRDDQATASPRRRAALVAPRLAVLSAQRRRTGQRGRRLQRHAVCRRRPGDLS